jgi:hypothetical protein
MREGGLEVRVDRDRKMLTLNGELGWDDLEPATRDLFKSLFITVMSTMSQDTEAWAINASNCLVSVAGYTLWREMVHKYLGHNKLRYFISGLSLLCVNDPSYDHKFSEYPR